jgi:hypothetical protein
VLALLVGAPPEAVVADDEAVVADDEAVVADDEAVVANDAAPAPPKPWPSRMPKIALQAASQIASAKTAAMGRLCAARRPKQALIRRPP